jgi:hypothetical protein
LLDQTLGARRANDCILAKVPLVIAPCSFRMRSDILAREGLHSATVNPKDCHNQTDALPGDFCAFPRGDCRVTFVAQVNLAMCSKSTFGAFQFSRAFLSGHSRLGAKDVHNDQKSSAVAAAWLPTEPSKCFRRSISAWLACNNLVAHHRRRVGTGLPPPSRFTRISPQRPFVAGSGRGAPVSDHRRTVLE